MLIFKDVGQVFLGVYDDCRQSTVFGYDMPICTVSNNRYGTDPNSYHILWDGTSVG